MEQLILHLIGDYVTQNDWLAQNKTKNTLTGYIACLIHALVYSLPFLLICSKEAWLIIFIFHFFIDKYRLAVYLIKFTNWNWKSINFGYGAEKPAFMSIWLMIIVDNTLHLITNYAAIKYLG